MSPLTIGIIGIAILFVLMFFRMPVAFSFLAVGFFGVWYIRGLDATLNAIATIPYTTATTYAFTVLPLFILMGFLFSNVGIAEEFYDGIRRWIGQFRGGLAAAVIFGNVGFGACAGDSISPTVTFTTISLPEMRKFGYTDTLSLGAIIAGGNLALLIPPSSGFILFGIITQTPLAPLLVSGVFPGFLLALLFIVAISLICWRNPEAGPPGPRTTFRQKMGAGLGMWAIVFVFLVIIGGLYIGLFTPTEAGAAGAALAIIMGLARKKISWDGFKSACMQTGTVFGMVIFLIMGVMVFNLFLTVTQVQFALASFVSGLTQSPALILVIIALLFFVLGMFIDILAMMMLLVPLLFPVVTQMGISPLHFGVIVVLTTAAGAISPPYGLVLYAIASIVKDVSIATVMKAVIPFYLVLIFCTLLLIFIPEITTWLPGTMMSLGR
jgi:tripartite ATP-independent transporter DctM subunit